MRFFSRLVACLCAVSVWSSISTADPLPGRDILKFQQLPLDNLTYPVGDAVNGFQDMTYWGHNEFSTAYSSDDGTGQLPRYIGRFMADDFADNFGSPVVHVKWWGSYPRFVPDFPVNKFLISFEEDIPADATGSFSRPGQPLLNQIVERGPLFPGSGTFTESPFSPGGSPLFEEVFEYNAELHLDKDFKQEKDTVYWLKIVALVDIPGGGPIDPGQLPTFATQWGWHNRDYSKPNPLASPNVSPGETFGFVPGTPGVRLYHFQDDAVTGDVVIDLNVPDGPIMPDVFQDEATFVEQYYMVDYDGPPGIQQFSKDLAFELYTVPEPSTLALALMSLSLLGVKRR